LTKKAITQLVYEISRNITEGVFGVKISNDVGQILRRLTLVAIATKFETK